MLKLGELGKVSYVMMRLGEVGFEMSKLGELGGLSFGLRHFGVFLNTVI